MYAIPKNQYHVIVSVRPVRLRVICICCTLFSCRPDLVPSCGCITIRIPFLANDSCSALPGAVRHFLALRPGSFRETSFHRGGEHRLLVSSLSNRITTTDWFRKLGERLAMLSKGKSRITIIRRWSRQAAGHQNRRQACASFQDTYHSCTRPVIVNKYASMRLLTRFTELTRSFARWNEMKIVRSFKNDPHPAIIPFHSFIITPSYALITM